MEEDEEAETNVNLTEGSSPLLNLTLVFHICGGAADEHKGTHAGRSAAGP